MTYSRNIRQDLFNLPSTSSYLLNYQQSTTANNNNNNNIYSDQFDSDSSSPPASTLSYTSSNSSSLANSPLLTSSSLFPILIPEHLSLSSPHSTISSTSRNLSSTSEYGKNNSPSPNDLAHYASSIIRNEAYALLALADRLTPTGPILDEPLFQVDPLESDSISSGSSNGGSSRRNSMSMDQDMMSNASSSIGELQSRTNVAFRSVFETLKSLPAHGKVLVTGVGKSGIVARKMVATFNSLGIPSVFLHPLEALHGDLGVVCHCTPSSPCDALLLISHSGATAELMRLIPVVRARVRSLIAVTRDPDSILARACTGWLDAGTGAVIGTSCSPGSTNEKTTDEADSELPAPTSSVICGLAMGDALALCLSKDRLGWDAEGRERRKEFFKFHPGGQLGLQMGREERGAPPVVQHSS